MSLRGKAYWKEDLSIPTQRKRDQQMLNTKQKKNLVVDRDDSENRITQSFNKKKMPTPPKIWCFD